MAYLGDYTEDHATLNFKVTSRKSTGLPTTLSGAPSLSVYKANGAVQSTAGITLSVDFDGITGLNNVLIDLSSDAFYAISNDYMVVISAGTVDGVSVVGEVIGEFSIENRFDNDTAKAAAVAALNDFDPAVDVVANVTLVDTTTANTDMRGTDQVLGSVAVTGTPTTTTVVLSAGSTVDNFYTGLVIEPTNGLLKGQAKIISGYVGSTRTLTIDHGWTSALASGDIVQIKTTPMHSANDIRDSMLSDGISFKGADIALILADSNELQLNQGNWLTATGFSTHSAANVRTEMDANSTGLAAIEVDTQNIQSRIPAALSGGKMSSDAEAIAGSTDGATRLAKATQANVYATVGAGSTTTSIVTSSMAPAAAVIDQFKGKIVTFDANTATANLRSQSTDITANTAAGVLTVTALTTAPVSSDIFVIT